MGTSALGIALGVALLGIAGPAGGAAFGTLVAVHAGAIAESVTEQLRRSLTRAPIPGSVWQVSGALFVRIPASAAQRAISELTAVWRRLRPIVIGRPPG